MPKILTNSRDNHLSIYGLVDRHESWLNQGLNDTDSPTFADLTLTGDAIIGGNLTVNGQTTIVNTDILTIKDNIVEINSGETGVGVTTNLSGVQINRGTLTGYQIVFRESDDVLALGEVGDLQVIATREDSPLSNGIMIFNQSERRLDSVTSIPLSTTFASGETSFGSSTGALRVTGGLGVSGDIFTDGRIYIKGTTYNNNIDSNSSEEFIITAGSNILLNASIANYVKIPADVSLSFGGISNRISSSGTTLTIASASPISIQPGLNQAVTLRTNSPLTFGASTDKITYDGTNLILDASTLFVVNSAVSITNSTASTSNITGALRIVGGMSISNTTDAVSSTNGGTFTTAGGVGIAKKLYVGGLSVFENVDENSSILCNGGISLYKRLSIGSNYSGNPSSGIGIFLQNSGYTYTDSFTTSSGTVNNVNFNFLGINSLSATNSSITTTNSSTLYIEGSPIAGTNQTIVNRYSLNVASGITNLSGDVQITSATYSSSPTTGALVVDGGVSIKGNLTVNRKFDVTSYTNTSPSSTGVFISITGGTVNDNSSIATATEMLINHIGRPTLSSTNVVTTDTASTFSIENSPIQGTNQTITNLYALYVKAGTTKLGGQLQIDGTVHINSTTESTSSSTGSLITLGGIGVAKNIYSSGNIVSTKTEDSISTVSGSIISYGGIGIAKNSNFGMSLSIGTVDHDYDEPNGVSIKIGGNEYNDTVSTGIIPLTSVANYKISNLVSDASVTSTEASTIYIQGAPTASGNHSITNSYSLYVNSGISIFKGSISLTDPSSSTNPSTGALRVTGGIGVQENVNVSGNLDIDGITNLDQTNVNTTDGQFSVTGSNGVNINVANAIVLGNTSGNITIDSTAGNLILDGNNSVTIDSSGGISIDAGNSSNFNLSSGTLTLGAPVISSTSTGASTIVSGTGGTSISTSDTTDGIKIGTTSANVPVTIGNTISEVYIGDNLNIAGDLVVNGTTTTVNSTLITINDNAIVVNSMPAGISDGGLLVRRYQTPNDIGTGGEVVNDTPNETSTFDTGSSLTSTLVLNASSSSVNNYYRGWWIKVTSGVASGTVRRIKSYDGTTKTATVYIDSDNSSTFVDGLDLQNAPANGDTYNLYAGTYSGMFYDDTNEQWVIGRVPYDTGAGVFPLHGYHDLHINSLVVEGGITYGGNSLFDGTLTLDSDSTQLFLARKNGNAGDVMYINTVTPQMVLQNPVNTVSSTTPFNLNGYNSTNNSVVYSAVSSIIADNTTGTHSGTMELNVAKNGTLSNFVSLGGLTNTVNINSNVNAFIVNNTTSSTSSSTGSLRLLGGLGINNTTDATSSSNGGSITTAGGVAIGKKLYVGDNSYFNSISTSNTGAVISQFSNNSSNRVSIIDQTAVLPSGVKGDASLGLGLYGTTVRVYTEAGVLRLSVAETSGDTSITSTTQSTSISSGSLTVSGGLGVAKNLYVGENIHISGNITSGTWNGGTITVPYGGTGATTFTSNSLLLGNGTGALVSSAMTYSSSTLSVLKINSTDTTESTNITSGAVVTAGGLGVTKNANIGGNLHTVGNIGVGTSNNVNGDITLTGDAVISNNTDDNTDDGSITIASGGAALETRGGFMTLSGNESVDGGSIVLKAGNNNSFGAIRMYTATNQVLNMSYAGVSNFLTTTDASSSSTGSVTLQGGMGIAKKLYVGTDLNVTGNSNIGTVSSGSWNGGTITVPYGGTGATTFTANSLLVGNGTGAVTSGVNISYSSNTLTVPVINSTDTTQSTSSVTGAVTLAGGLGVAKNVYLGEALYVTDKIGAGASTNINNTITVVSNGSIGINTVNTTDDGVLFVSGSGSTSNSRGALITLAGNQQTNTGRLTLSAGTIAGGNVSVVTNNTERINVGYSGSTTFSTAIDSTSSSSGVLVISSGGLAIGTTTNAVSSTNGGGITCAGGAAFSQDVRIGGNLYVTGSVPGGVVISSYTSSITNITNISTGSNVNGKVFTTDSERTFSGIFLITPSSANATCTFEFSLPAVVTNWTNSYDLIANINGYHDNTNFYSIENVVCYAVVGQIRGKIKFTSGSTSQHVIQFNMRYTIV